MSTISLSNQSLFSRRITVLVSRLKLAIILYCWALPGFLSAACRPCRSQFIATNLPQLVYVGELSALARLFLPLLIPNGGPEDTDSDRRQTIQSWGVVCALGRSGGEMCSEQTSSSSYMATTEARSLEGTRTSSLYEIMIYIMDENHSWYAPQQPLATWLWKKDLKKIFVLQR